MSFTTFREFAQALCRVAGVKAPDLGRSEDGLLAFHLVMDGVTLDLVQLCDQPRQDSFVLVTFGPVPEAQELQVLRSIAHANYALVGTGVPVYGLNPGTGDLVLRLSMQFHEADPSQCLSLLRHFADLARQWRADPTLAGLAGLADAGVQHNPFLFA